MICFLYYAHLDCLSSSETAVVEVEVIFYELVGTYLKFSLCIFSGEISWVANLSRLCSFLDSNRVHPEYKSVLFELA
jgi:hypothetical protein